MNTLFWNCSYTLRQLQLHVLTAQMDVMAREAEIAVRKGTPDVAYRASHNQTPRLSERKMASVDQRKLGCKAWQANVRQM